MLPRRLISRALSGVQKSQTEETVFDQIIRKEITSQTVYEDEIVLAFRDVNPQSPTHVILIPKQRSGLTSLSVATAAHKALLGHLMWAAAEIAKQENLEQGWRLVVNSGVHGSQSIHHLHLHILGGRQMSWPPG